MYYFVFVDFRVNIGCSYYSHDTRIRQICNVIKLNTTFAVCKPFKCLRNNTSKPQIYVATDVFDIRGKGLSLKMRLTYMVLCINVWFA